MHWATMSPSKVDLVAAWAARQPLWTAPLLLQRRIVQGVAQTGIK